MTAPTLPPKATKQERQILAWLADGKWHHVYDLPANIANGALRHCVYVGWIEKRGATEYKLCEAAKETK
jgi:hypothetical protein